MSEDEKIAEIRERWNVAGQPGFWEFAGTILKDGVMVVDSITERDYFCSVAYKRDGNLVMQMGAVRFIEHATDDMETLLRLLAAARTELEAATATSEEWQERFRLQCEEADVAAEIDLYCAMRDASLTYYRLLIDNFGGKKWHATLTDIGVQEHRHYGTGATPADAIRAATEVAGEDRAIASQIPEGSGG